MKITNAQFDALVGHLVATLDKFKVPAGEKGELLGLLGPMRSSIVEERTMRALLLPRSRCRFRRARREHRSGRSRRARCSSHRGSVRRRARRDARQSPARSSSTPTLGRGQGPFAVDLDAFAPASISATRTCASSFCRPPASPRGAHPREDRAAFARRSSRGAQREGRGSRHVRGAWRAAQGLVPGERCTATRRETARVGAVRRAVRRLQHSAAAAGCS